MFVQPKFFSLSNITLPKCQTFILLRDLKLTPTPENSSIQLTCHHKIFAHKLRLIEYFDHYNVAPDDQKDESLVKVKSDFHLPRKRNKESEAHITLISNINVPNKKSYKKINF